jgi:predicted metallo-beta-lactamase superfamily hydrolase
MKITPIAADSMGTRSMATFVETEDCNIFIDPSVRLAPKRSGHTPHRLEKEREREHWRTIKGCVKKSQVLTISHYHFDHHNPDAPSIYKGKTVLLKDPEENINRNQQTRARTFINKIKNYTKKIQIADGEAFEFGNTTLNFSKPVQHGPTLRMGYVVELAITSGKRSFVHTSDIQGASVKDQMSFILDANPDTILMDGPFSTLMMMDQGRPLKRAEKNIIRIMEETDVKDFLIDHHFLREEKYRERIPKIFKVAEKEKVNLTTCAGYLGMEEDLLEAKRKKLYKADEEIGK